jgi:hypothetical protein
MKGWLSCQREGKYTLTSFRPKWAAIFGFNGLYDFYVRVGDPLGLRNLCREGMHKINPALEMKPGELKKVKITIEPIEEGS